MGMSPLSRHLRLLPALAGLGLLGLVGPLPAAAQKLTLGDLTDRGTATIGGSGTTASGAYSFSGGAGPGTSSYHEVDVNYPPDSLSAFTSSLTVQTGGSVTLLNENGGAALITGGSIGGANVQDGSSLDVSGGSVGSADALNGGQINVTGGTVGPVLGAFTSTLDISGGSVASAGTSNDCQLNISGGVTQYAYNNEGGVSVTGGAITRLENVASDFGPAVNVSGGTIQTLQNDEHCQTYVSGGNFQFIVNNATFGQGFVDISGTDLKAIQYSGPGPYDALLTGTLSNGTPLDALYTGSVGYGSLEFNDIPATLSSPIPEASSSVSLALLLCLGLGGLAVGRRRKSAACLRSRQYV